MKTKQVAITVKDEEGNTLYYDGMHPADKQIRIPIGKIMQMRIQNKKVKACNLNVNISKVH